MVGNVAVQLVDLPLERGEAIQLGVPFCLVNSLP